MFSIGRNVRHKQTGKVYTVRGISHHRGKTKLDVGPELGRVYSTLFEPVVEEVKKVEKPATKKAPAKKAAKKKGK